MCAGAGSAREGDRKVGWVFWPAQGSVSSRGQPPCGPYPDRQDCSERQFKVVHLEPQVAVPHDDLHGVAERVPQALKDA